MQKKSTLMFALIAGLGIADLSLAAEVAKEPTGRTIAFDRAKGNCLACHEIPGDPEAESPGDIGPSLDSAMVKKRFSDRAKLRAKIWDATASKAKTSMPPFGKHQILTEQEVDLVVDYVYGL